MNTTSVLLRITKSLSFHTSCGVQLILDCAKIMCQHNHNAFGAQGLITNKNKAQKSLISIICKIYVPQKFVHVQYLNSDT